MPDGYDYNTRTDRDAYRKRFPYPGTGLIGNTRMHSALDALDEADLIIAGLLDIIDELEGQQAMPDDSHKREPSYVKANAWMNRGT